jgi:hypothetical protein
VKGNAADPSDRMTNGYRGVGRVELGGLNLKPLGLSSTVIFPRFLVNVHILSWCDPPIVE